MRRVPRHSFLGRGNRFKTADRVRTSATKVITRELLNMAGEPESVLGSAGYAGLNGPRPRLVVHITHAGDSASQERWLARFAEDGRVDVSVRRLHTGGLEQHTEFPDALVLEAADPQLALDALNELREKQAFRGTSFILSLTLAQVAQLEPSSLGFDDFVVRPWEAAEIEARVRAIRRRNGQLAPPPRAPFAPLVLNRDGQDVRVDGRTIPLTRREFALLSRLSASRGTAVSREDLLRAVWGTSYTGSCRTIDIHVLRLRKKLGKLFPLQTLRGVGYKLLDSELHSKVAPTRELLDEAVAVS